MFGIGGLNPVSLLATTALGPMGGIVAQLATQVLSQFNQQFIQQLGQQAGLPQSAIELAQSSYTSAAGDMGGTADNLNAAIEDLGRQTGASPADIGDAQRSINDLLMQQANDAMETDEAREAKAGGKGGTGWLRALAQSLGEIADRGADRLEQQSQGLDNASPSESAQYTADAQAFTMLMNAINTTIKSIGESLGSMAKRQ